MRLLRSEKATTDERRSTQIRAFAFICVYLCLSVVANTLAIVAISGVFASDFFFLQMSDPQFGMHAKDANFIQETANTEFAIASANGTRPSLSAAGFVSGESS